MAFIDIPTEQTTAITDAILALLALASVVYLWQTGKQYDLIKTRIWMWAFGLLAFAAVLGAVAHGFKMSKQINSLFWQPLNLALGLAVALFAVGVVYDIWGGPTARKILPIFVGVGIVFYVVTRLIPGSFLVFILYEAVAMLFALGAYIWLAAHGQLDGAWVMAAGVLVTIVAAGIQASEAVFVTLIWEFDFNGIFHVVQMIGLVVLVVGLRIGLLAEKMVK
jgi:hypothetical protein